MQPTGARCSLSSCLRLADYARPRRGSAERLGVEAVSRAGRGDFSEYYTSPKHPSTPGLSAKSPCHPPGFGAEQGCMNDGLQECLGCATVVIAIGIALALIIAALQLNVMF